MSLPCIGRPCPDVPCIYCQAAIDAAQDGPVNDYADDFTDNFFERANYPKQWEN